MPPRVGALRWQAMDRENDIAPRAGWLWYFAYGSNMDPARLFHARLAAADVPWGRRIGGRLAGWRLSFDKPWSKFPGAGVANISADPAGVVFGTLNEMPPAGLDVLDRHEGVAGGHYARRAVTIDVGGRRVDATTYVARGPFDPSLRPACTYLAYLLAGRDLLPAAYLRALEARTCIEGLPEGS